MKDARLNPVAVETGRPYQVHIGEGVLDRLLAELPTTLPFRYRWCHNSDSGL